MLLFKILKILGSRTKNEVTALRIRRCDKKGTVPILIFIKVPTER